MSDLNTIPANNPAIPAMAPQGVWMGRLRNGKVVLIRPVHSDDATLEQDFVSRLTPEVMEYCFLGIIKPTSEHIGAELTDLDEAHEFGILALVREDGDEQVIGTARYRVNDDGMCCDCAAAVDPSWRQCGVGSILMNHLIGVARMRGIHRMYAVDAVRCAGAHALASYLGFHSRPDPEDPASVTFELVLDR
ncbi:GNAT family N-acetyltransferase [Dyella solisilvae]|uniref:GNAT family N-acetyltransferase n=1 Tax=Dyella solisilvae TaxID=1920168 RepID=A0A370K5N2_9GAMM|nr:GNAT family N-acetyltransferase [Dyella solisilvae]RDI97330.1 GNAT family N-acetyltransferase [Dyella solisilvae]